MPGRKFCSMPHDLVWFGLNTKGQALGRRINLACSLGEAPQHRSVVWLFSCLRDSCMRTGWTDFWTREGAVWEPVLYQLRDRRGAMDESRRFTNKPMPRQPTDLCRHCQEDPVGKDSVVINLHSHLKNTETGSLSHTTHEGRLMMVWNQHYNLQTWKHSGKALWH